MRALEGEFGIALLVRGNHGVSLTAAGRAAHEHPLHVREQRQQRDGEFGHRGVVGGVDRDRVTQCLDPDALLP
ncbi:hypothetical protein ACIA5H_37695 [Nocardia sp. NPDC051900]|uniref:hypothetical protein n=1 Tax=Nocardia sp. NPDC051900 TaxID=3364326 RepID=UPI00378AADF5